MGILHNLCRRYLWEPRFFLTGPYGSFRPRGLPEGTPLLFLAGGIGITPVLSVIADTETRRKYPMALLWSVRDKADESAGRGLAEFAENDQIFVRTIRTRESVPEGASRHIDATLVREALDFLGIGKRPSRLPRRVPLRSFGVFPKHEAYYP